MLKYTEEKCFTQEQVQQLFLSVGWVSGPVSAAALQGADALLHGADRLGW